MRILIDRLISVLLVSKSRLPEGNAIEMSHHYSFLVDIKCQVLSGQAVYG